MSSYQEPEIVPVNATLADFPDESGNMREGKLHSNEHFWRDHQPWLQESGYLLRPRYHPDWVASWIRDKNKDPLRCEDAIENTVRPFTLLHHRLSLNTISSIRVFWMPLGSQMANMSC